MGNIPGPFIPFPSWREWGTQVDTSCGDSGEHGDYNVALGIVEAITSAMPSDIHFHGMRRL